MNLKTKKKTGLPIKGENKEVKIAMILGGIIFTVVLISLFITNCYDVFIPLPFLHRGLLAILGCILLLISLIIGIISARELGNSWRVGILEDQETELVQTKIYKFCRNPYFLSYFIMFLAFFLIIPRIVLLLLVIASILYFHYMVKNEEKYLEKIHGARYIDYCKRVGRYLPRFNRND
ncbi:MAG: isoprenylcysteine carboxylmethyltransferase family protein [Deltaproteobacteria bacterium]|nr:isoprenylcysteine carboxylmethyltransferase family protein [Deltaproteobacteria bacterium]